jgi:hypothetical protein
MPPASRAESKRRVLANFTASELMAEIIRRRDVRVARRPIVNCETCRHFTPGPAADVDAEVPYNPCALGNEMNFRAPDPDDGPPDSNPDWGFYLIGCKDRNAL